jgi:two-component system sensor histidine kinase YesM
MIKSSRSEEAATLADYMGRYFQFITRDTQNEESLEREVAHAQTYTNIQSLAYGNRIQVSFPDPPAEAAEMQVPRLVLQPLLENAFEHALESKRRDAALSVGYRIIGRSLEIDVADNGEELSDEALDELNRRLSELESGEPARIVDQTSGLLNVHRRLVLRFGPRAGIKLYRSSQGGLLVRLSLPLADAPTRPLVQDAKL